MTDDIWTQLSDHHSKIKKTPIRELFSKNSDRFAQFSLSLDNLLVDFSKTSLDDTARDLLVHLARDSEIERKRDDMFSGHLINQTEGRAALHTALRNQGANPVLVDGKDVMPDVRDTLQGMSDFATGIRVGSITAINGKPFTDIVNIGIGGSDLGPVMATMALRPYHDGPRCHFVSNVDGAQISDLLNTLNPAQTLFIIASKTFTTIETMTNANTAKTWSTKALGTDSRLHFAAVSTAKDKTTAFGILPERVFGFEDWVGGRYSVWGPIGLPLMIAIGPDNFTEFLAGGYQLDQHFLKAPLEQNIPVMMGLTGIWHNNICGFKSRAILPYDQRLARLPAYLQQLDMESNGKRVKMDGSPTQHDTGPIIWGEPGTNGQHAFYQLIHQGGQIIPCEFLVAAQSHEPELSTHQELLLANCLAQSEALMNGRNQKETEAILKSNGVSENLVQQAAHRVFDGNRPSLTIIYKKLTPHMLGMIIALYEHRVFVEGAIWGINSFDQWGVELGKELATEILPLVRSGTGFAEKDGSTRGLLTEITRLQHSDSNSAPRK
jgi:glucose-6-phosphate isomerase